MQKTMEAELTVETFYEKSVELNKVYQNRLQELNRTFNEKQGVLFYRLSEDNRKIVMEQELQKLKEEKANSGLVDQMGNKIGIE